MSEFQKRVIAVKEPKNVAELTARAQVAIKTVAEKTIRDKADRGGCVAGIAMLGKEARVSDETMTLGVSRELEGLMMSAFGWPKPVRKEDVDAFIEEFGVKKEVVEAAAMRVHDRLMSWQNRLGALVLADSYLPKPIAKRNAITIARNSLEAGQKYEGEMAELVDKYVTEKQLRSLAKDIYGEKLSSNPDISLKLAKDLRFDEALVQKAEVAAHDLAIVEIKKSVQQGDDAAIKHAKQLIEEHSISSEEYLPIVLKTYEAKMKWERVGYGVLDISIAFGLGPARIHAAAEREGEDGMKEEDYWKAADAAKKGGLGRDLEVKTALLGFEKDVSDADHVDFEKLKKRVKEHGLDERLIGALEPAGALHGALR